MLSHMQKIALSHMQSYQYWPLYFVVSLLWAASCLSLTSYPLLPGFILIIMTLVWASCCLSFGFILLPFLGSLSTSFQSSSKSQSSSISNANQFIPQYYRIHHAEMIPCDFNVIWSSMWKVHQKFPDRFHLSNHRCNRMSLVHKITPILGES